MWEGYQKSPRAHREEVVQVCGLGACSSPNEGSEKEPVHGAEAESHAEDAQGQRAQQETGLVTKNIGKTFGFCSGVQVFRQDSEAQAGLAKTFGGSFCSGVQVFRQGRECLRPFAGHLRLKVHQAEAWNIVGDHVEDAL